MLGSEVVDAGAAVALSSLSAILDDFTPIDPAPETRPDSRPENNFDPSPWDAPAPAAAPAPTLAPASRGDDLDITRQRPAPAPADDDLDITRQTPADDDDLDITRFAESLTFDAPAPFSAAADEFRPRSTRAASLDGAAPSHAERCLAPFFLDPNEEAYTVAVFAPQTSTDAVLAAAAAFGAVSGVDDQHPGVVFAQFDDARRCTMARTGLARRLRGCRVEAVGLGPAASNVVVRGLPKGTMEDDVRAVFSRYGYGEIRSIETFENDFGVVFRVAFFGRSDAARAARELSSQTSGVVVDLGEVSPVERRIDQEIRQALQMIPDDDPWTHLQGGNTLDANAFEYRPPSLPRRAVSDGYYGAPPLYALQRGRRTPPLPYPGPQMRTENPEDYVFDKDKASVDPKTTLMVRNIPNKYTQRAVLDELDEKFARKYDFFYLPIDFKNKCNVGYAFVNLIEAQDAVAFHEAFDGRRWTCFRSGKVCAITYARIQGKQAMIQRFQNSSLLAESLEVQPRLFVSQGPDKGKPERFPGGAELPVELPPPVVEPPARRARNRRAR